MEKRKAPRSRGKITAGGMLRENTPVEDWTNNYGLWVKREDLACPPPGPPFSKTRGVYRRVKSREEKVIGVLDTYHSQAGHAVARACQVLGKSCVNYYPEYKYEPGPREPQLRAKELGATLVGIPAGRSAVLYHSARKMTESNVGRYPLNGYMMPNALKLWETVEETAREVPPEAYDLVILPASSATIAAGVIKGFLLKSLSPTHQKLPRFVVHLGYSRSHDEVKKYLRNQLALNADQLSRLPFLPLTIVDEGYHYKDKAVDGETPPWPCNPYYDLKAFRWWMRNTEKRKAGQRVLFWNVG